MLRRLSDVTIGSLDKILKISSKTDKKEIEIDRERKRKFKAEEEADSEKSRDVKITEKNASINCSLRKSKGHWNLKKDDGNSNSVGDLIIELTSSSNSGCSDFNSNDEQFSDLSLPSDQDLLIDEFELKQYLSKVGDKIKMKSFESTLWRANDYNLIPLNINEIYYWNDFYQNLMDRQNSNSLRTFFNDKPEQNNLFVNHPDLTEIMRAKLINWIFETTLQFNLHRETIYSTQMIIDLYLVHSNSNLLRDRFQLLGLAALLISSKLEEIKPPNLFELVQICDESFTEREIANFELEICGTLRWHLAPINLLTWSNFYFKIFEIVRPSEEFDSIRNDKIIEELKDRVESAMDLLIHSSSFLNFKPSKLSAALIYLCSRESERCRNQFSNFKLITGIDSSELNLEFNWLRPYINSSTKIVFNDPEKHIELNDFTFDLLLKNNKDALNFLKNQIKKETNEKKRNLEIETVELRI